MKALLAITKALADENRLRVVLALAQGELCVCQLIELLGLAPSTVSKHMAVLHQAGLVAPRKDGRWIYYRLVTDGPAAVQTALALVHAGADRTVPAREDARRLKAIRKMDRDQLCSHYHT